MSTLRRCVIQFAFDFAGALIAAGVIDPAKVNLREIEDRGLAALTTFEDNSPESSQSEIVSEAVSCVSSKLANTIPQILEDVILAIIAVLIMLITISLVAVVVISGRDPYAPFMVLFLGLLLIAATFAVLSNATTNTIDTTPCTETALVEESIFQFQSSQAISSAFCAYASA